MRRGERQFFGRGFGAPPVGFEPTHPAPEAGALSPELWGPGDVERLPASRCRCDIPTCRTHEATRRGSLARVTQGLGRVLVVDDDEVIRQLIAVNLTLEGFDVATAIDGQDCLDKVQAIDPDVITLDVMMPRLDGWETAVQLRKAPRTAHIKVVLITARAQEDDITRGTNVGADAYLTKPFDPGEMIRVVRELAGVPPA
jgi:CheY-like chemotaxis protein